jgi:hypothetical protein
VVNDLDKFDDRFTMEIQPVPEFLRSTFQEKLKENIIHDPQYSFKNKHILQEAMDSDTGYLMPYDGAFYVPEGYTYVKASTWGDNMTKREIRYRNTALNGIFYYDKKEMSEAQKRRIF